MPEDYRPREINGVKHFLQLEWILGPSEHSASGWKSFCVCGWRGDLTETPHDAVFDWEDHLTIEEIT